MIQSIMFWVSVQYRKWRARQSDPNRAWEQLAEPGWEGAQGPGSLRRVAGPPDPRAVAYDTGVRPPRED